MMSPASAPNSKPVLRFAPSPNGYLHLGHALSALECKRWADSLGGRLLLRIEDTDLSRARPQYRDAILDDLKWLGLKWEEPVRVQSDHLDLYQEKLQHLYEAGLAYPAPASRTHIARALEDIKNEGLAWPCDPDGSPHYPFAQRDKAERPDNMPLDGPIRLDMQAALKSLNVTRLPEKHIETPSSAPITSIADPSAWGDVLLRGRDRPATYHLAVVVDDAVQGITHVVRGKDLEPATSLHRLLQELLGLPALIYHHHRLIMGEDGRKLSKSEGAKSLRSLRRAGVDREALIERLTHISN
ncbi:MAG: tRNA glutamyl-Q(34) synthetase GluQRS [Devosiaceae bacterium]